MSVIKNYKDFVNEMWGAEAGVEWIKEKLKSLFNVHKNIPLHIRACMSYITLRSEPMTEEYLSDEEISALYNVIYFTRTVKPNARTISYTDFGAYQKFIGDTESMGKQVDTTAAANDDFNPVTAASTINRISMTVGNCSVVKTGTTYTVTDVYDFNCITNFPEAYEWENFPSTFAKNVKQLFSGQAVKGAEGLLSWYQKLGYTGYPVKITLARPADFVEPKVPKALIGKPVKAAPAAKPKQAQSMFSFFGAKPAPAPAAKPVVKKKK